MKEKNMSKNNIYRKLARWAKLSLVLAAAFAVMPLAALDLTQKINVTGINMTVKELFKQIEGQSGYTFAFNKSAFDTSRRVNVSVNGAEIGEVLNAILQDSGFSYIINNRHIIILPVKEDARQERTAKSGGQSPRAAAQQAQNHAPQPDRQYETTEVRPSVSAPEKFAAKADLPVVKAEEVYMEVVDNSVYMVIPGQQVVEMTGIEPKQYNHALPPASATNRIPNVPKSPRWALKTNLLADATTTMNLGIEVRISPKWTMEVMGYYNPWSWSNNRKFKSIIAQPEFRYWVCDPFAGHFIGVHAQWGHYNFGNLPVGGLKDRRYQGDLYGAGFSYGYSWYIGKRWALEATVGVGYNYLNYEKFDCAVCGTRFGWEDKHYVGITKLGLNLSFLIK